MVSTPSELWPVRCWVKLIWSRPLDFWEPLSQPARQHPLPQPPPCCWRDATAPPSPPARHPLPLRLRITYHPPWRLLFVSFVTGGILLCLEVVWFRFLRLYVALSSTAFSIMLAVVLVGIGLGGVVSAAMHSRLARSNLLLPILLLFAAILTLLCYEFFPAEIAQTSPNVFDIRSWPQIAMLSFALMFPVALISGIIFPLIVARVQTSVGDRMNSTGLTTLFNTSGAALGPLLTSFVLLPAVGFQWSLLLSAASYTLLAIFVSERGNWSFTRPLGIATSALLAAFILIVALFPYRRDQAHFRSEEHTSELQSRR